MKWVDCVSGIGSITSLPVRGAWIEIIRPLLYILPILSLPVRGAWIEMKKPKEKGRFRNGRSPCGERGLKLCTMSITGVTLRSRSPCGERGLKFDGMHAQRFNKRSLPVRGAWIEMHHEALFPAGQDGRSPCGERGLKFKPAHDVLFAVVAPRAGSVD